MEFIFFVLLIYIYFRSRERKRSFRRKMTVDQELRELLENSSDESGKAAEIKNFLISVYHDDRDSVEKYSDSALENAQKIIDRSGPAALYFLADIASQLAILSSAQVNGFPTQISAGIDHTVTPESIINSIVKI